MECKTNYTMALHLHSKTRPTHCPRTSECLTRALPTPAADDDALSRCEAPPTLNRDGYASRPRYVSSHASMSGGTISYSSYSAFAGTSSSAIVASKSPKLALSEAK